MEGGAPLGGEENPSRRRSREPVSAQRRSSSRPGQPRPSHSLPPGPGQGVGLPEPPSGSLSVGSLSTGSLSSVDTSKAGLELQRLREENHALLARVASLTELSNSQGGGRATFSAAAHAPDNADQPSADTKQALRAAARAAATAAGHESAQSSDSEPDAAAAAASSTAATSAAASRVRGRSIDERLSQDAGYQGEPETPTARESAHMDTPDDYAPDDLTGMSVVRARRPQRAADGESESERTLTLTRTRTRTEPA